MKRKIIIGGIIALVIGVITVVIIFNMDWGGRTSTIKKTEIVEYVDSTDESGIILPGLDNLSGKYEVSTDNGNAELLFEIDGLKNTQGAFEKFKVEFDIQDDFTQSILNVKIDAKSINTENEMRDDHLKDEDYFNVKKYPNINFKSSEIEFADTIYYAHGELEFMGEKNPLTINFDYVGGQILEEKQIEVFEGKFEFDRTKYGMEHESGIGDIVKISFYLELEGK